MVRNIDGIEIEVIKKKVRRMHLHVTQEGKVYVSCPFFVSAEEALKFASANMDWVKNRLQTAENIPSKEELEPLKGQLKELLDSYMEKWQAETGLYSAGWKIRYMTSRWGSCLPSKRTITFNLQLASKPSEAAEYVALHEILHIKYPNHGREFKAALDYYMPDWRARKGLLK